MKYISPKRGTEAFVCPHCGVLARQYHFSITKHDLTGGNSYLASDWLATTICEHCRKPAIWLQETMLYPDRGNAPLPNEDTPDDVLKHYEEAASVANLSPRAASALLRLGIQKLCVHLGGKGENINEDVATLVNRGLPKQIQRSLDIVRVIGNHAVHPGQIDVDNPETVGILFHLINVIVETMISSPKRIDSVYDSLPESARQAIEKRDQKK